MDPIYCLQNQSYIQRWSWNGPVRYLGKKISIFSVLGLVIQRDFPPSKPSSEVIFGSNRPKSAKNWKMWFLNNKANGHSAFYICFTLPIGLLPGPKKVLKKWGAKGLFGPAVKMDKIMARPFWGWKKAKSKNFFSFNSLLIYALLMVKRRNFSQTYHNGARSHHSSGPKTAYFSPKT